MNKMNIIANIILAFIIYIAGFLVANCLSEFDGISFQSYQNTLFLPVNRINTFSISILLKNLTLIIILILGGFIFGFPTFLNIFSNGYMFGVIFAVYSKTFKINQFLLLTLPHGIFEIPAIIIAGAAEFKIPYEKIIRYLAGKKERILTKDVIKEYLTLALISIILIVIAAFVEAYVTPKIAEYFQI